MILGIGIDSIAIERFEGWHTKKITALRCIFTPQEIEYCTKVPKKSAERFAVRFAAKEAFYKALCSWLPDFHVSLRILCPAIEIIKTDNGAPKLHIDWNKIGHIAHAHLSLTHTATQATALVMLTQPLSSTSQHPYSKNK